MRNSDREAAVLAAIIETFIDTGEPVPSSTVSRSGGLSLSPASVRSTMSGLMDKGYLEQPHVSAGRIPTAKGIRLYAETIMQPAPLPRPARDAIASELAAEEAEISRILRKASAIVSSHCCQLGVVLAPSGADARWRAIEFAPVSQGVILAILVLDGGLVRSRLVSVTDSFSQDELSRFSNYLNANFRGRTLQEARVLIHNDLQNQNEDLELMCIQALTLSRAAVDEEAERELFVEGTGQVIAQADRTGIGALRNMLSLLEERSRLLELLDGTMHSAEWSVTFTSDPEDEDAPIAVVSAPYAADESGRAGGVVSAVGPLHMNYQTVVPAVSHIASVLAAVLRRRFTQS